MQKREKKVVWENWNYIYSLHLRHTLYKLRICESSFIFLTKRCQADLEVQKREKKVVWENWAAAVKYRKAKLVIGAFVLE